MQYYAKPILIWRASWPFVGLRATGGSLKDYIEGFRCLKLMP